MWHSRDVLSLAPPRLSKWILRVILCEMNGSVPKRLRSMNVAALVAEIEKCPMVDQIVSVVTAIKTLVCYLNSHHLALTRMEGFSPAAVYTYCTALRGLFAGVYHRGPSAAELSEVRTISLVLTGTRGGDPYYAWPSTLRRTRDVAGGGPAPPAPIPTTFALLQKKQTPSGYIGE